MKQAKPLISVILPIYNVEKYLPRCLDSIATQTFSDFEVLMIDDGSPDKSGSICHQYQQKDSRFHYYRKPNGGAASARNYGIMLARGKYFAFIDSDDFLNKNYLKVLYGQVEKSHCDIAICSYVMLNQKGTYYLPLNPNGDDINFDGLYYPQQWVKEFFNRDGMIYTAPWCKLFNRKVFKHLYFPSRIEAGDDQFTIWRAYLNATTISFNNKQAYCYFVNSSSLSHVKVNAYYYGVTCLEEQMAVFKSNGWNVSYMIHLYRQRLQSAYNMSLKNGHLNMARNARLKLKIMEDQ